MTVMNIQVFRLRTIKISDVNIFGMNQYKRRDNASMLATLTPEERSKGCKVVVDTHADTSFAGKYVRVLEGIDCISYNGSPFNGKYGPI